MNKLITNYDPETQNFTLQDEEEECLIVITKKQLQALIALYRNCCED